jgi:hypothetical protein
MMNSRNGFIDPCDVGDTGKELARHYQAAEPFPSIMIDDFLPTELADLMLERFGSRIFNSGLNESFDRAQERLKTSYQPDTMHDEARTVFYAFNSRPFITVIENVTGLKGLIPDPHFLGAGFHEIRNGGHLSIHADFNHHKPMNLERRVNLLIYLNKGWEESYGGQIELWTEDMREKTKSWSPIFNRCVIFNTTSNSMHGNPQSVQNPLRISRKSIALYYYTSTWDNTKRSHTTQFQVRRGTNDKRDWSVKMREWKEDFLPPIVARTWNKARHRN